MIGFNFSHGGMFGEIGEVSREAILDNERGRRGVRLIKEIARRHERVLQKIVEKNNGQIVSRIITEGPVTANSLLEEFKQAAKKEGIWTDNLLEVMRGVTLAHNYNFEATAMFQVFKVGLKAPPVIQ